MIRLFRWFFGYVYFSFSGGFYEDFLTECFNRKYGVRDISKTSTGFAAFCNLKDYKKLHRLAYKCGGRVKIIKKYGLPFILFPLKGRLGFAVGATAFAIIISLLSCFVWNVEIIGNKSLSSTEILSFLEHEGLKSGVMWSSISRSEIGWDMMSEFDEISWVHINKVGSTARVEINETKVADPGNNEKLQGINVMRKTLEASAEKEQKNLTIKESKDYNVLHFFSIDIPLYIKKQSGSISSFKDSYVKIKGVTLPIGITTYTESLIESKPYMLTDKECLEIAQKKLKSLEEKEFDGFEIINRYQTVKMTEERCTIECAYIIRRK